MWVLAFFMSLVSASRFFFARLRKSRFSEVRISLFVLISYIWTSTILRLGHAKKNACLSVKSRIHYLLPILLRPDSKLRTTNWQNGEQQSPPSVTGETHKLTHIRGILVAYAQKQSNNMTERSFEPGENRPTLKFSKGKCSANNSHSCWLLPINGKSALFNWSA